MSPPGAEVEVGDDDRCRTPPNPRGVVPARRDLPVRSAVESVADAGCHYSSRVAMSLGRVDRGCHGRPGSGREPRDRRDDRDRPRAGRGGGRGRSWPAAREAQPGWDSAGVRGPGRGAARARAAGWAPTPSASSTTIVSRDGQELGRRRSSPSWPTGSARCEFWARKRRPSTSPTRRSRRRTRSCAAAAWSCATRRSASSGVIGPWNYPLTNSFGDCIPALAAGNAVVLKPSEVTPLTSLLMAEMLAESRAARGRLPGGDRGRGDRGGAGRRGGLRALHGLGRDREEGDGARGRDADAGRPRAGRQGPDDRAGRRRPGAGRERRRQRTGWATRARPASRSSASTSRSPSTTSSSSCVTERVEALRQGAAGRGRARWTSGRSLPAPDRPDRGARRRRGREGRPGRHRRAARGSGPGRFFEPTVLADVDHSMLCMTEETFGPTLPVMRVARRRRGGAARERRAVRPRRRRCGRATRSAASASPAGSRRGRAASTTPSSTTRALELPMGGWKAVGAGRAGTGRRDPQVHRHASRSSSRPATAPPREAHNFPFSPEVTAQVVEAVRFAATSELLTRRAAAHAAALCDTFVPSLRPPRSDDAARGFWARAASHLGVPEAIEVVLGGAARRSGSRASASCSTRSPREGLNEAPPEAREEIIHGFADSGPEALAGIHTLRGADDDAPLRAPRPRHGPQPELGRDRLPGPGGRRRATCRRSRCGTPARSPSR